MKKERNYSMLVEDVEAIKRESKGISNNDLMKALSKKGWNLNHYRNVFFDVQDMKNFFRI